ncbi:MAG: hypothetical protein K8F59_03575 [Rhodobacteraceae bacterium]|nr:hypothetical protein [Paracoccaceae bacterium]
MTTQLLSRRSHRPGAGLAFLGPLALVPARVHEFCGPARRTLAMLVARATSGPVFWIAPAWAQERLHGDAMAGFADPGRFTFVGPGRGLDLLWCMEEVLRSGAVPLVICELPAPPGLTPVRRLHLAAEAAAREAGQAPLGLLLVPGDGGAPGVESRWSMAPAHDPKATRWRLERLRARMDPPKAWAVEHRGARFMLADWPDPAKGPGG